MMSIPSFECPICLCPSLIINCLTLSCDHRFCKDCLVSDWTQNIQRGFVSPSHIKCPSVNCGTPITLFELRYNLPEKVYAQYLKVSNEIFQTTPESKEFLIKCPDKKCETPYFICRGASYFFCSNCQLKYCAECLGEWEAHKGLSCEEYKEKNQSPEEFELKKAMQNSGAMRCPHCQNYGVKPDGCNFIYCTSAACQKRRMFCYLCGVALTENDHFSHFLGKPFGNECIGTKEKLEKGEIKGINNKMVKVKKDNETACPGCKSKDPDVCELIENFERKIGCCSKCGGKFFCVKCGKEVKEVDLWDHYQKGE